MSLYNKKYFTNINIYIYILLYIYITIFLKYKSKLYENMICQTKIEKNYIYIHINWKRL